MDISNKSSKPLARFDLADLEQFKSSIRPTSIANLETRKAAIRKRRKIQHPTGREKEKEVLQRPLAAENDQPISGVKAEASGVKQEKSLETDLAITDRSGTNSNDAHVTLGALNSAGSEDDSDEPIHSQRRPLVPFSNRRPHPTRTSSFDASQQRADPLTSWAPRKDKAPTSKSSQRSSPHSAAELSIPSASSEVASGEASGEPKHSKKTEASSSRLPDGDLPATTTKGPPKWYRDLQKSKWRSKDPLASNTDVSLANLKDRVKKCKALANKDTALPQIFQKIRDMLHSLLFMYVTGQLLRDNLMLSDENGLPQMFDRAQSGNVNWPFDIQADALELYTKWSRQDFDTDIMRGIRFSSKISKGGDSLDPSYSKVDWKKHGNNFLVIGQWWPTQLCTMRDGAHGSPQAGIAGAKGQGAYSVVVSGGLDPEGKPYPDEDHGDWLLYCGTDSKEGISANTAQMLENNKNQRPVRLLRSHNLKSRWAPQLGFRYDGLYEVKSAELIDPSKSRYQFRLERVSCITNIVSPLEHSLTIDAGSWARPNSRWRWARSSTDRTGGQGVQDSPASSWKDLSTVAELQEQMVHQPYGFCWFRCLLQTSGWLWPSMIKMEVMGYSLLR
nr:isoform 2 of e3 ubiquitin-protein ligase orthrus 2 [Quercus suber]